MILYQKDITVADTCMFDDFGIVFYYKGGVFRAVRDRHVKNCLDLLNSELYQELINEDLIPKTSISEIQVDGFSIVLEHEKLNETKPHHWSFSMFRDAALSVLRINNICNKYGYELLDSHPSNILFRSNKPIHIDFGSIIKRIRWNFWIGHEEFLSSFYLPLLVWSEGDFFLSRKLIEDSENSKFRMIPMNRPFQSLTIKPYSKYMHDYNLHFKSKKILRFKRKPRILNGLVWFENYTEKKLFLKKHPLVEIRKTLRNEIDLAKAIGLLKRPALKSQWGDYHERILENASPIYPARFLRIVELIKKFAFDAKDVIDLAGNQGFFSSLLASQIHFEKLILADYDEEAIDKAFNNDLIRSNNIQPVVFNFLRPFSASEYELFKSDLVLALAVTHHLVLSQYYGLDAIFRKLKKLTKRYLIVEFMPLGLWAEWNPLPEKVEPEWYTEEWFTNELKRHFKLIYKEKLEMNRIVFISEII